MKVYMDEQFAIESASTNVKGKNSKIAKAKLLFILFCLANSSYCKAQSNDKINLSKIIFHLSRCNGACPRIDLEIDSSKNLYVDREYFKTKSETDWRYSGRFKGILTEDEYNNLVKLLQNCELKTLKFPDSDLMDGVVVTIIVYYNGQRKYLKSPEPPGIASDLIAFLTSLGDNKTLGRMSEEIIIEE